MAVAEGCVAVMGLLGWLGLLFVGLKLTGVIAWSWWLVLAPWFAFPVMLLGFVVFGGAFMAASDRVRLRRARGRR